MREYHLTHPLYAHLEAVVIEVYVEGARYTQRSLAARIAVRTGEDPQDVAQKLDQFLRRLNSRGHYVPQPAGTGFKSGRSTQLTSPRAFNWSSLPVDAPALEVAARALLADRDVDGGKKSAVRSALRLVLELPTKCDDTMLLNATALVVPDEVYALPGRAFDVARARDLNLQTAKNHRTSLRALLRYGAERRLIPLVFPRIVSASRWTDLRDQYLPPARVGITPPQIAGLRGAWGVLERTCCKAFGAEVQFEDLTRDMAEEAVETLVRRERRRAEGYKVRELLRYLAKTHGVGPWVDPTPLDRFAVSTPGGPRPALYFRGPDGEAGDAGWNALCELLDRSGLPESLTDFLRWYEQFVTLSPLALFGDQRFPPRRARHQIGGKTLLGRMPAIRALLGAAAYRLEVDDKGTHYGLALSLSSLTPELLFGRRFRPLVMAIVNWWRARSDLMPKDTLGKGTGGQLRQMVIGLGMLALAHYERLRHQRNLSTATRLTRGGDETVDALTEEAAIKSPDEVAAWDAYTFARQLADTLASLSTNRKGRTQKKENEFRHIRRILKATPPAYWISLQDALIQRVRHERAAGRNTCLEYHHTVLDAVVLGLLISTGCRIEELALVRLDVQFRREERHIELRAQDRKNGKPHTALVQAVFLPDDILNEYLQETRPRFIKGDPAPTPGKREAVVRTRPLYGPHPFLLVSSSGRPYACLAETLDGGDRDQRELKGRVGQLGTRFQARMARLARSLGVETPDTLSEFGPHTVRAACGFGIFLCRDEKAAAQYLGDTIETALEAYSAIDGAHVDAKCLVGFQVSSCTPSVIPAAILRPQAQDYATELGKLIAALKEGLLTRAEYDRAKDALTLRPGAAGTAEVA